jgi:ligand-binding sensor domain-containing protein
MFVSTGRFLYRRSGISSEWEKIDFGRLNLISLLVTPAGDIYAGTKGNGIYKSSDFGDSWTEVNEGLTAIYIKSLAGHYSDDIIIGTMNSGVFIKKTNGTDWLKTGIEGDTINSILTVSSSKILAGTQSGVYQSTDKGTSWQLLSLKDTMVYSLAMDSSRNIYAGSNGILRSFDGGKFGLRSTRQNYQLCVLRLIIVKNSFAAGYTGVLLSTNNGENWQYIFPILGERMAALATFADASIIVGAGD